MLLARTLSIVLLGPCAALHAVGAPVASHGRAVHRVASPAMAVTLFGSQQSRSPLVNWYMLEAGIDFSMAPPRPNNHPFDQIPFLTDDDGVEVFESGACLLYLADKYASSSAAERATWTPWVVWANSELDGLCFGAVPGDHRVRGESMSRTDLRAVARLNDMLGEREWLVGDAFSVADAAVASYLNYVPLFHRAADLSATPNTVKYMQRCAERPTFAEAFGEGHQALVLSKCEEWLAKGPSSGGGGGGGSIFSKLAANLGA